MNKDAIRIISKNYPYMQTLSINKNEQIFLGQELAMLNFEKTYSSVRPSELDMLLCKKAVKTIQEFIYDDFNVAAAAEYLHHFIVECQWVGINIKDLLKKETLYGFKLDGNLNFTGKDSFNSDMNVGDFIKKYLEGEKC